MSPDAEIARQAVENTAKFLDWELRRRSPFHLAACGGCGGPSFQQPCSLCGYYPMGSDKGHWHPVKADRDFFVAAVERSGPHGANGNLATWALHALGRTVGYSTPSGRARIEDMVKRAAALEYPEAGIFWKAVVEEGQTLSRPVGEYFANEGWGGIEELQRVAESQIESGRARPEDLRRIRAGVDDWVSALHAGDLAGCRAALAALSEAAADLSRTVTSDGNLIDARRRIGVAEMALDERLSVAAPAP